jgi:hypothetical protein
MLAARSVCPLPPDSFNFLSGVDVGRRKLQVADPSGK